MKKFILILLSAVLLSGCGRKASVLPDSTETTGTGNSQIQQGVTNNSPDGPDVTVDIGFLDQEENEEEGGGKPTRPSSNPNTPTTPVQPNTPTTPEDPQEPTTTPDPEVETETVPSQTDAPEETEAPTPTEPAKEESGYFKPILRP